MFARIRARMDRLLTTVVVLLGLGLCASVYIAFSSDKPKPHGPESPAPAPETRAVAPAPLTEADVAALWAGRDPERLAADAPTGPAPDVSGMPQFIVRGIVFSTARPSVAFIEVAKSLGLYREGQLADGWRIERIERGVVTVLRDGVEYRIPVSTVSYAGRPWTPQPETSAARTIDRDYSQRAASTTDSDGVHGKTERATRTASGAARPPLTVFPRPADADATVAVPQDLVEKARTDPKSLMGDVKVGFVKGPDGRTNGVVLNHVPTGSLAARYGFAPGDRIVAVNGQALTSFAQASQLYGRYRNDSSATVTIERNGVRKNVVYYAR